MQEIAKLKNYEEFCCTEAARARQLTSDVLSTQKEESKSTVNQLLAQFQDMQDKVNSLNGAKEHYDPEAASSSGLSHVSSQPRSVPSPRGMISRDSCLQIATQNSLGTSGHACCRNHREHSAEIPKFGHRLLADRSQLIQAKLWNRARY